MVFGFSALCMTLIAAVMTYAACSDAPSAAGFADTPSVAAHTNAIPRALP